MIDGICEACANLHERLNSNSSELLGCLYRNSKAFRKIYNPRNDFVCQTALKIWEINCEVYTQGVIQVATGNHHQDEAVLSVERIRPCLNGRPIILVTDKPERIPLGLYDRVIIHPEPQGSYRDKILPLLHLPYKRTLFLDTDVEILSPIDDIFEILKSIDFVGCHAPVRWSDWKSDSVPEAHRD